MEALVSKCMQDIVKLCGRKEKDLKVACELVIGKSQEETPNHSCLLAMKWNASKSMCSLSHAI